MKLALIISSLSAGGAERVISLLANHWAARGDEVSIITIDESATDCYPLDTRVRRIPLGLRADSDGFLAAVANNGRRIAALRSALKQTGARFLISFGEFTNVQVLVATRFTGVRCVVSERTDPLRHRVGRIWQLLRRITYPMADALVVQTDALLPWAQSIVGKKRAHVVPNPVRDMRHSTEVPTAERAPVCIAAGRLVPAKAFDILLEAFGAVAHEAPEWRLVILGEGPERERLAALARKLGIVDRVSLSGWVAEPGVALAQASVFVLSSHYEGFPNALLEAMACGLPAVATACRGPAEIIDNEVDGLLVEVGSAAELGAAMLRLMKDETLRLRLGRNAATVSTRYKLESIVHRWDLLLGVETPNARASVTPHACDPAMRVPSILLLTRALDTGGAQRQLVELAVGLQRAGWKVTVATFYRGGALEVGLQTAGVRVLSLDKRGRWDVLPFVWRLVRLIRRERPHFAKGYLVMSNMLLCALRPALAGTRIVWGVAASNMDLRHYDWLSRIEFRLSIVFSRWADLIICNSEAGRRYHLSQGYAARRMVVIPNGIDVHQFRRDEIAGAELRSEWNIHAPTRLIGLVGRVDPMKDHENFLRAAAQITARRPETRFVCIGPGTGSYQQQMFALANSLGLRERLIWAGERSDMWRVYNALDVLVSSSRTEGLPNVVAEAMASGVPCVVTDVGDSAHIVGEHGWVCPPRDSTALAQAILCALSALPADPAALRQRICTHYSTAALVQRTADHLCRLVPNGTVECNVAPD